MRAIRTRAYLIFNVSFVGIILFIFLYSGIFSAKKDNHPIPSYYEVLSGKTSPTSGLSRSFSEVLRGNFQEARKWNINGIPLFLFFLVQLFMRVLISWLLFKTSVKIIYLVLTDSIISVLLFLWSYKNLLLFWNYL
ncbi:MAG: hypothetical protein U9N53_01825 [Bacteroidota bacterium]|nr:hypothetical protein [Bacteroidota bacterium]